MIKNLRKKIIKNARVGSGLTVNLRNMINESMSKDNRFVMIDAKGEKDFYVLDFEPVATGVVTNGFNPLTICSSKETLEILKKGNQIFTVDGKGDFSKPNIFEQISKIKKAYYKKYKKTKRYKNK